MILGRRFSPLPSSACLTHLGMHTPSAVTTASWLFVLTQCVDALAAYEWLLCYLCVESHRKVQSEMAAKDVSSEGSIMRVAACVECVCVLVLCRMHSWPERTARSTSATLSVWCSWRLVITLLTLLLSPSSSLPHPHLPISLSPSTTLSLSSST